MSVKLFCGFDWAINTANAFGSSQLITNSAASVTWGNLVKPPYLFHNKGVATLDQTIAPPNYPSGASGGCFGSGAPTSSTSFGCCYVCGGGAGGTTVGAYTGGTTTTRATWATAQGHQIGIVRSLVKPSALSANEYWFTFELQFQNLGTSSLASSYTPSNNWASVFRWGDVELRCKQTTFISGTTHDIVFSVMNNGSEVATVTVPGVVCGSTFSSNTWLFVSAHVKLHGSTGLIDFAISGNAQSVSYTGQNTVNTIAEASATEFYFSPPVLDNATNAYVGGLDHILIDDASWPTGRPCIEIVTLLADDTLTDAAAAGTSPTTVTNALSSSSDAKQLRFSTVSGKATMTNTMPSTSGMDSEVLGFQGVVIRMANRYALAARKVAVGVTLSSVDAEDNYAKALALPFSSINPPPETGGVISHFFIPEKGGGGKFALTDLASVKTYLKVTT